ncbi:hypothetical protein [Nocardioides sp.]|uniref:hypothetical protein n=1 Tax=Nocardioides sp. TaxID=35761 RepID=UPI003527DE4A
MRPRTAVFALALVAAASALTAPAAYAAAPRCGGQVATIVGASGRDTIVGTDGADVIVGLGGNDTIDGGDGDDLICGGDGGDLLRGGAGADRLYSGGADPGGRNRASVPDVLLGGAGDDRLVAQVAGRADPVVLSWADAPQGVSVRLGRGLATGWGYDTLVLHAPVAVVGSDFGDRLRGLRSSDDLDGGGGDDHLWGGGGDDWLTGGPGDDTLRGGPGRDRLLGRDGSDRMIGGKGGDLLSGEDLLPDRMDGGPGNDYLADTVIVSAEQAFVGGPGHDWATLDVRVTQDGTVVRAPMTTDLTAGTLTFPTAGVTIPFSSLAEVAVRGRVDWTALGTPGPDVYRASSGAAIFAVMGAGDDEVRSSGRDDRVDGGPGIDTARTGGGTDTCVRVERLPADDCEHVS